MKCSIAFLAFVALIGPACESERRSGAPNGRAAEFGPTTEPNFETVRRGVEVDVTFLFGRTIGETKSKTFTVTDQRFALLALRPVRQPLKCVQKAFLELFVLDGAGDDEADLSFYVSSLHHWANLEQGASVPSRTLIDIRPRADASIGLSNGWVRWDVTRLYRRSLELRPGPSSPAVLELRPPTFAEPKFMRRFASVEANSRFSPRLVVHVRKGCGGGDR